MHFNYYFFKKSSILPAAAILKKKTENWKIINFLKMAEYFFSLVRGGGVKVLKKGHQILFSNGFTLKKKFLESAG